MSFPGLDNQNFSDQTLKGFLLKNVDNSTTNPAVLHLNQYLIDRVDKFWNDVVVPLRKANKFDGNKINWYFEVYKEGYEARRLRTNPFPFVNLTESTIKDMVAFYKDLTLKEYIELGSSFLTNSYSLLSSWVRDQMALMRLEHIYTSENPHEWILRAEEEEHGIMEQKPDNIEGVMDILRNIGLLMSRKI